MARIVIVDDEKLVLYGIRSYLTSADSRHEVVGSFTRAEDALAWCRKNPPDVVLTDIRMPGMDGLELIAALKAEQPSLKVVVLSCHDEFRLVRKAFTLGASEYILKDEVEETNLLTLLQSLRLESPSPPASPGVPAGTGRDLARFFSPFPDPLPPRRVADIRRDLAEAGMRISGKEVLPALLAFRDEWTDDLKLIPWGHDAPMLAQIVHAQLEAADFGEAFLLDARQLVCLFELSPDSRPSKHETLRVTLHRVLEAVGRYCNRQPFIGVPERAVDLASLGEACQSARRALEYRFYEERGKVLFADTIRAAPERPECPPHLSPELGAADMESAIEEYLGGIATAHSMRPRIVCLSVSRAFRDCLAAIVPDGSAGSSETQVDTADLLELISHADSLALLRNASRALARWIASYRGTLHSSRSFSALARVFLEQSYRGDVQLPEAAAHFHMTPSHFCEIFHREMGTTYIDYLNERRIAKAKALMCGTDGSLKEIAASVGYHNPNYFSRVFKRYTGSTVSAFRRTCRQAERSE